MKLIAVWTMALGAAWWPTVACAAQVQVVGVVPGRSATLRIDGARPVSVRIGETVDSVTVVATDRDSATLRVDDVTEIVPLLGTLGSSGAAAGGNTIQLSADPQGHFLTQGAINGRAIQFLVDTGATAVMLTRADAGRLRVRYRGAPEVRMQTANGQARGWRVRLDAVTVSNVTVRDVEAVVADTDALPVALLGMTFLNHFDLQRRGSTMLLQRRR